MVRMATQRNVRTATYGDRVVELYEPTDGQMALLAQQVRTLRKGTKANGAEAFLAVGTMMVLLDKLFLEDEDRDFFGDLLLEGEITISELLTFILGGDDTMDGEVEEDAAPQTIVKRTTKPAVRKR